MLPMRSGPLVFKGQHMLNAAIGLLILGLIVAFCVTPDPRWFWAMTALAFAPGRSRVRK